MKTNRINDNIQSLVAGCHRTLKKSGLNPSLTNVRNELEARYDFALTENEIGEFLLEAGRQRGYSSTSGKASALSKLAAQSSYHAVTNKDKESHLVALQAHQEAARAHRAAAAYHDAQEDFHRGMADSCQARRGIVVTLAELEARKVLEAEKQRAHCSSCDSDFDVDRAKQISAENFACPVCGERVNVNSSRNEEEPTSANRMTLDGNFGWSIPAEMKAEAFKRVESVVEKKPDFENQKVQEVSSARKIAADGYGWSFPDDATREAVYARLGKLPKFQNEHALNCARAASSKVQKTDLPNYLLYMPGGVHVINPSQNGKPVTVAVEVDRETADTLDTARLLLTASGKKPFFSTSHNSTTPAFYPTSFRWDTKLDAQGNRVAGVWAFGEWTDAGRETIERSDAIAFSPSFFAAEVRSDPTNPVPVVCNTCSLDANLGALETNPAFPIAPWS